MDKAAVTRVKGNTAFVRVIESATCSDEACAGCKVCLFGKPAETDQPVLNELGAKAGDIVLLERTAGNKAIPALLLFGLPLLVMLIAVIVVSLFTKAEWVLALTALIAAGLMLGVAVMVDRLLRKKGYFGARMVEIIKENQNDK